MPSHDCDTFKGDLLKQQSYVTTLEELTRATDLEDLASICGRFALMAGAEHFSYSSYTPLDHRFYNLQNLDPAWVSEYKEQDFCRADPRLNHCTLNDTPIYWLDFKFGRSEKARLEAYIMERASLYGLVDGVSIPLHSVGSEISMLGLSTSTVIPRYSEVDLIAIKTFLHKLHHGVKELSKDDSVVDNVPRVLTQREKECLKWSAAGKTGWEIAQILGCSQHTVAFHLKNSVNKLAVKNRTEAVARAIAESHIVVF